MDIDMDKMPEYNVTDENKTAVYEEQKVDYAEEYKKKTGIADLIIDERENGKKVAQIKTLTPETVKAVKDSKGKVNSISIKNFDKGYNGSELSEVVYKPKELNECAVKLEELIGDLRNNNEFSAEEKAVIVAGRISQVVATDLVCEDKIASRNENLDSNFTRSSSTIGALIDGKANSQGYADLFKNAMDSLGISCRLVSGEVRDLQTRESHPSYWNQVEFQPERWGNINVFELDKGENLNIEYIEDIEKVKTEKDKEKLLERMTKSDSKEVVSDRYITMLSKFNATKYVPDYFDAKVSARQEKMEEIYDKAPQDISDVLGDMENIAKTEAKIARYENQDKQGMGKTLKRLKLSKDKYLVIPLDKELTPEELEQWKEYQKSQNENVEKAVPLYYKQKEADRIFSSKGNEFREGLKVSEDQLMKNDGNAKDDNIKVKDDELER